MTVERISTINDKIFDKKLENLKKFICILRL